MPKNQPKRETQEQYAKRIAKSRVSSQEDTQRQMDEVDAAPRA